MKKLGKIYIAVVLMFLYIPIFVLIVFCQAAGRLRPTPVLRSDR